MAPTPSFPETTSLPEVGLAKPQTQPVLSAFMQEPPSQQTSSQTQELMKMLVTLNESVRSLGSRFNSFEQQIESKFDKVNAELVLLKNRVEIVENR